jgi:hypothetical protein
MAHAVFANFIAGDKSITPKSPSALGLPLTKRFGHYGWVVMRTGWDSALDSMVTLMASTYARVDGGFTNFNNGSFTIDRRGPLALNSGSAIHHGYAHSTVAFNTMVFPDPNEAEQRYWDEGDQRYAFPQFSSVTQMQPGRPHDIGGIKRLHAGGSYDYVFADVTRAYNGPSNNDGYNTLKVENFTRQLVYFRPPSQGASDRIVVFDRTKTVDPKFEKRWLLHPSAPGSGISINGTGTQVRAGKTEFVGADLVTATNTADGSSGKLFSRTLLPAQRKIVLIGGPGHEYEDSYGNNDTERADSSADPQYAGTYRVEVIPTVRSTTDTFLHVIEATDASTSSPTATGLLTGTGMVGARVGNQIAAFSTSESTITSAEFVVDQAGTYEILVADLQPGASYDVAGTMHVATGAGTIRFTASAAAANMRVIVRLSGMPPPTAPPAPPTNVRIFRSGD